MDRAKYERAVARFDAANAADPAGHELDQARRLSTWVKRLEPSASEALLLASRCQHLMRWKVARDRFPEGTAGYHRWRREAARFHAEESAKILRETGYGEEVVLRVQDLNLKKGLGTDPEVQTLEDALCLVFLQTQLHEFRKTIDEAKAIDILRKTWAKMSERGRAEALRLPMAAEDLALIRQAVDIDAC